MISSDYNDIYLRKLHEVVYSNDYLELYNDTFTLTNVNNNVVHSELRKFNRKFADAYYDWIIRGETDISLLHHTNVNAKNYDGEYRGRFTSYGPRISSQIYHVITELQENSLSRRACIMILSSDDQIIARGLRNHETKCEYPCTAYLNFFVRDGKLNMAVSMRSNNYILTVCIDVYVFTCLQKHMAHLLSLEPGAYYHHAVNAHIFPHQVEFAKNILEEIDHGYTV